MESIINFFEQYWGATIFGGVSIGTLVTFIVVQIKDIISNKAKGTHLETAVNKADKLCEELNKREEENKKLQTQLTEQQQYFEQVQAATFQAISYLVVASKLPTEDKIVLQEKFTNLVNTKKAEYKELIKDEVESIKTKVDTQILPDAKESIETAVSETKSLLDKYTTEE